MPRSETRVRIEKPLERRGKRSPLEIRAAREGREAVDILADALRATDTFADAAKLLGVHYVTVWRWMKKYGVEVAYV